MELTYHRKGDYLFPNLVIEKESIPQIGKYGLLRKTYLKEHRPNWYQSMLATGKLSYHLAEIDQRANERLEQLTEQMARTEGVTEALKESDPMNWIQRMNNLRNRADEIIMTELVYS
ncbi:MAG: TnpV protein [Clostridia bacterium]|nr:TnpV protein [Clostridia bacterium]